MGEPKAHPSECLEFVTAGSGIPQAIAVTTESSSNALSPQTTWSRDGTTRGFRASLHRDSQTFKASEREHRMTFREGSKLYPKAVGWSILISTAIVMEGYDTALITGFYTFDEFRQTYGTYTKEGGYQISAKWQTILSNSAVVGSIIGLFANGVLTERYGYRHTMIAALAGLAACIFLVFFAVNLQMLLAGQILCGISWGVFSTLTTTYAAEVVPLNLRGYLTANVNLCWLIGQITAASVLRGLVDMASTWSFRIPFGLQWAYIIVLLAVAFLAPESPWWLVRNGRLKDAERMLLRLTRRGYDFDAKSTIAMMDYTNETEIKIDGRPVKEYSYMQCFRGTNLRRTEIACMIFMIQNFCGLPAISFAAYFYNRIGFDQKQSYDIFIGMHGLAILGAFLSVALMKNFGRRTLYLAGLSVQFCILLIGGIVSCLPETHATLWATASMTIVFIFVFDSTVGPLTYCIVAEIPSTRLRVKTVVLSRVAYNICALITNVIETRMLNPTAWDWRGKSYFFWAGACASCIVYCYFRLPETKGLTFLELDLLFEKGAKAKQFSVLQKKLADSGYFSFHQDQSRRPQWRETRCSDAFSAQPTVEVVKSQGDKI